MFSFSLEYGKIEGVHRLEVFLLKKLSFGMFLSMIGILFVCLTIMDILPASTKTMKIVYIGIGWVFIIAGSIVRFKHLKQKQ